MELGLAELLTACPHFATATGEEICCDGGDDDDEAEDAINGDTCCCACGQAGGRLVSDGEAGSDCSVVRAL